MIVWNGRFPGANWLGGPRRAEPGAAVLEHEAEARHQHPRAKAVVDATGSATPPSLRRRRRRRRRCRRSSHSRARTRSASASTWAGGSVPRAPPAPSRRSSPGRWRQLEHVGPGSRTHRLDPVVLVRRQVGLVPATRPRRSPRRPGPVELPAAACSSAVAIPASETARRAANAAAASPSRSARHARQWRPAFGWISKPSRARAMPGPSSSARPPRENLVGEVGPAGDAYGDGHAARPELLGKRVSGLGRRPSAGVQPGRRLAVADDDREEVAAGRALVRLCHDKHPGRRERGVARVAAASMARSPANTASGFEVATMPLRPTASERR